MAVFSINLLSLRAFLLFISCSVLSLISSIAVAEDFVVRAAENGGFELYFVRGGQEVRVGALTRIPPGTRMFHWGMPDANQVLVQRGHMTTGELSARMTSLGKRAGGLYVSLVSTDTFGVDSTLIMLEARSPLLELSLGDYDRVLELTNTKHLSSDPAQALTTQLQRNEVNRSLQKAGIHALSAGTRWKTLIHPEAVTQIKTPTPLEVEEASHQKTGCPSAIN